MARPSSIDRLPDDIQALIGRLRRQGRTIDEIREALTDLDVAIPRSTLARHTKDLDELAAVLEQSQGMAKALLDRLGADPDQASATARLNAQMAHTLLFKLQEAHLRDGGASLDGKEALFLSSVLRNITSAEKVTTDQVLRLRKEFIAEQKKKLDALEHEVEAGRTVLTLDEVRRRVADVYGV